LKKITSRTPEQEKQYQQISAALTQAGQGLNDYYGRLYTLFGKNSDANKQVADVQGDAALLRQQITRMPHTVALYTMMTNDRYSVLVITGTGLMVGRKYDIDQKTLNLKVGMFQRMLRDPAQDPRPLAQELYKILIEPVKADLDQAQAQTLVWSLDGVLRYIPMAALYDGKQYLVENYNIVAFTPASIPYLSETPELGHVSAVAMGISRKYEDGLNPLPTVVSELDDIINDPLVKDAHGVLPGSILLNGQFTEKAMEGQLAGQHAVVHIASHFVFRPGDDNQSYLLLAGKDSDSAGYHLTVADFRDDPSLTLNDTDLLTLSACDTGVQGIAGNGREVDGLATTAQLKGARAVISPLWAVDDSSTGDLMADFYKRWADGGGKVMKVEALRQAQLDLLTGKVKPTPDLANATAPASFASPYYWAPFILMGNWR
jgi:CHAT domain-containing protein